MGEVDICIDIDVKIRPKTPATTPQQIFIGQAETYLKYKLHKIAKQLEEELIDRWDSKNPVWTRDENMSIGGR